MQGLPPIHFHLGVDGISLPLVFLTGIVTLRRHRHLARQHPPLVGVLLLPAAHVARRDGRVHLARSLLLLHLPRFRAHRHLPAHRHLGRAEPAVRLVPGHDLSHGGQPHPAGRAGRARHGAARRRRAPSTSSRCRLIINARIPHPPPRTQNIIFPLLLVGFGILVGSFPFHSWAPPGYASAPPAAAMLHAGILKKFAHLRHDPHRHPDAARRLRDLPAADPHAARRATSSTPDSSPSRKRNCPP